MHFSPHVDTNCSPWDWDQIGNNTCYTPKVGKLYVEKGHLCCKA